MTIDELKAYGADTEEGMQRCLNMESMYFRLVKKMLDDPHFQKLYDAVDRGDLDAAFEAAHALKGSAGNLALKPIFTPVCEITELLRTRTDTDYSALVAEIRKGRDDLARICEG